MMVNSGKHMQFHGSTIFGEMKDVDDEQGSLKILA